MHLRQFIQPIITSILLCLLTAGFLHAQPTTCFDFEDLELDAKYGKSQGQEPGDTIKLVGNDIITTVQRFIYSTTEESGFEEVSVVNWEFGKGWGGENQFLFISNINLLFDFSQQPGDVSEVHFDFVDGGGEENIGVNGHTAQILEFLHTASAEIAPGVRMEVELLEPSISNTNIQGTVFLSGNIQQLVIGGQELGFDNLCITVSDVAPLCIANLVATAEPCTPNGIFFTELAFDTNNPPSDSFQIIGNGKNYGKFPYGQSSYRVGPTTANHDVVYWFEVMDALDPNCSNSVFVEPPCSDINSDDCEISEVLAEKHPCQDDGSFLVDIAFKVTNPLSDSFFIRGNGQHYGTFAYGKTFYTVGPLKGNGETEYEFVIIDQKNTDCTSGIDFGRVNCDDLECEIFDLAAEVNDCQEDGTFDLEFEFEYKNANQAGFDALIDGEFYDFISYSASNGYKLTNLKLPAGEHKLTICSNDNPDCCTSIGFEAPFCKNNSNIYGLSVKVSDCKFDGSVDLLIDFNTPILALTLTYSVYIGDRLVGSYPQSQFPLTISKIQLNKGEYKLTLCLDANPEDCNQVAFEVPHCEGDCHVSEIKAEISDCFEDGIYNLKLDFEYVFLTSQTFEVFINGERYDTFSTNNLPIIIEDLKLESGKNWLGICVYQSSTPITQNVFTCCTRTAFEVPVCDFVDCEIRDLEAGVSDCKEDGTFVLEFKFQHNLVPVSRVKVLIDGDLLDYYSVSPTGDYRIPKLKYPAGEHELTVCSTAFEDCCNSITFEAPDCKNTSNCKIYDVFAEAHPCKEDGTFLVDIEFNVDNPESARFKIVGNAQNYGTFEYGKQFYTIGPIKGDSEKVLEFLIIDLKNADCHNFTELGPISCDNDSECLIGDLRTNISECRDNGTFDIKVDFEFEKESEKGFNVFIDEEYIETYGFLQLPIVLNGMDIPTGEHRISICRNDLPNCCLSTAVIIPECGTCAITNVTAIASDCNNEDYFSVELKFDIKNPSSDRFRVIGNNQLYGVFPYGKASYTIGPLDGDGETLYEFIVQDLKNNTCASFAELEKSIDCEKGFVWPGDANFDNITDNFDLLNIGLAFGKEGPPRNNAPSAPTGGEIAWEAQEALDWEDEFINGLNIKHADCNGDGFVNTGDIRAINENYFFTHGPVTEKANIIGNENDPALYVDFPALAEIKSGVEFKAPIIFGSNDIPAEAHGLAFTLRFDPQLITNGKIEFSDSWFGNPNLELLSINKNFSEDGIIEIGLSRTDKINPIGAGVIGNFIVIIDDIEGFTGESGIEILKVQAVDKDGNLLAIHTPKTVLISLTNAEEEFTQKEEDDIKVFPNPTQDILTMENNLKTDIKSINIRNISGKFIQSVKNNHTNINVSDLIDGLYIIEVKTATRTYYRKFVKQ